MPPDRPRWTATSSPLHGDLLGPHHLPWRTDRPIGSDVQRRDGHQFDVPKQRVTVGQFVLVGLDQRQPTVRVCAAAVRVLTWRRLLTVWVFLEGRFDVRACVE